MFGQGFFSNFGGMGQESEESEEVDNQKLYQVLGVPQNATAEEIKKQYRKMAIKHHPDKGGDADTFKEINAAHEILSDPEKRRVYDKFGLEGLKRGGGAAESDIFDLFFGGGRRGGRGGRGETPQLKPIIKQIEVPLEVAYTGKMSYIDVSRKTLCLDCSGKGGSKVEKCTKCKGQGVVIRMMQLGPGMYTQAQAQCETCEGSGERIDKANICKGCRGNKLITRQEKVEVAIPIGVPDNYRISIPGKGDEHPEYRAGDLVIVVKVAPHALFKRVGNDLFMTKKIGLIEALTGFSFNVKRFDQEVVIEAAANLGVNNGDVRVVEGLGMPHLRSEVNHGNLYIQFTVEMPTGLSADKLAALRGILPPGLLPPVRLTGPRHSLGAAVTGISADSKAQEGEEEDDEDPRGRPQAAQCRQQ